MRQSLRWCTLALFIAGSAGCGATGAGPALSDLGPSSPVDASCPSGSHAAASGCDSALAWQKSGLIGPARDHHATFVAAGSAGAFLYVVGGTDHYSSYLLADVQRAPIAADGSLGTFANVGMLPAKLAGHAVAVVDDVVVLAGGVTVNAQGKTVLSNGTLVSRLAPDGSLGAWLAGPPIPSAREHLTMVVQGRSIYLAGGLVGNQGTTDVERAVVQADGTLGAWTPLTPLPARRSHHAAVLAGNAVYILGGLYGDPAGVSSSYDDVLRAAIKDDGSLDAWATVSKLPAPLATHSATLFGGAIYLYGGIENDADFVNHVRRATVADDGSLGAWQDATPLPVARGHVLETPMWNDTIYSVGGSVGNGSTLTDVVMGTYQ